MSFLDKVTRGKIESPYLILIYGTDGVGKSSFAAAAPKPIFLGSEDGTRNLDVARLPQPKDYEDVKAQISDLGSNKHEFRTLVIDSVDWLEPLVWQAICKREGVKSLEKVGGGYGKGYTEAQLEWREFCGLIHTLQGKTGMNVIMVAHSFIKPFYDPEVNVAYDRHIIKMHEKSSAILREFVDAVLFANFEVVAKEGEGLKKAKAYGDGTRVIFTERRPAFDAKNRFGLPFEMPLSWQAFEKCTKAPDDVDSIKNQIKSLLPQLPEKQQEQARSRLTEIGDNIDRLKKTLNTMQTLVEA